MYRIANISPVPFFEDRGTPIRVLEEVRSLQKLGNRVTVFAYHLGRNIKGIEIKRIPSIPWYRSTAVGANFHKIYLDVLLSSIALKRFLERDYDIIHAFLHEGVAVGSLLRLFRRRPIVFDAEGSLTGEMLAKHFLRKGSTSYRFWHRIEGMLNRRADEIITSSNQNAKVLTEDFGIDQERVTVIGDGVDTDIFSPDVKPGNIRKRVSIPQGRRVVTYIGTLHPYQGIDGLIGSIPEVLKEAPETHFLIIGFPNIEHYSRMARRLGVQDNITFTGKVSYFDIPRYLSLAHVGVSPKIITSGEGNEKVYNYMAMGIPSVVFDYPVNRHILGNLGVYASAQDFHEFAEMLAGLLNDEKRIKKLGRACREKAIKDYSWARVSLDIMKVYRRVA